MRPLTDALCPATETEGEIIIIESRGRFSANPFGWRPSINAYRCQDKFVVYVDLAGVPAETLDVTLRSGRLVIRGTRPSPEPGGEGSSLCQLLALEIDHGTFERSLDLPAGINPDDVATEYRDGLYRIAIGLRT